MRALMVTPGSAPAMAAVRDNGVNFRNGHSLFPTFTTANASAMATGHYLGDTGDFNNTIYTGFPVPAAGGSVTPFLEHDGVLGQMDGHFRGDYLNETTLLDAARSAGYSTAAIGKLGPALIFDHTNRSGEPTIVIDDSTGSSNGIVLSAEMASALRAAGFPLAAPSRGENGKAGNATTPGTAVPNVVQQTYFADVATKIILPMFKARGRAFLIVYWSRDPDGTQHNQGDSLTRLEPGINGPTSLAAIKHAGDNLAKLLAAVDALGMKATTNVFVTADHGFSTISKKSLSSPAAKVRYADVPEGLLPPGFLALDLSAALRLPLFDPENKNSRVPDGQHPKRGNGLIGKDAAVPGVVVAANGGSDLIYLPKKSKSLARKVVRALLTQDYVSGIFVDDALGDIAGALPLSAINLKGSAVAPQPSIVVNFRSFSAGCGQPSTCSIPVTDSGLQQGQGMHGSFSRGDTHVFMAASGPDFKRGFADDAPASSADVGRTLAYLMHLEIRAKGRLQGRVLNEAMPGAANAAFSRATLRSRPAHNGLRTILNYQTVGSTRYFTAAGFPGQTLGLSGQTAGMAKR